MQQDWNILTAKNGNDVNRKDRKNVPSSFFKWYEEPPKSSQQFGGEQTCLGCACTIPITGIVVSSDDNAGDWETFFLS